MFVSRESADPDPLQHCHAELEPGHGSPGHRVTGSVIMSGSGRVSGQSYLLTDPVS